MLSIFARGKGRKKKTLASSSTYRRLTLGRYYVKVVHIHNYFKYFIKQHSAVKGTDATFIG